MNITYKDIVGAFGRFLLALLFLLSGFSKLTDPTGTIAYIASSGLPFPTLSYAAALFVEILLALFLVIGFKTKITALLMAVFAFITAIMFHKPLSDPNQFIHFFKNISIAGGMLQLFVFGGGSLSVDKCLKNRKR